MKINLPPIQGGFASVQGINERLQQIAAALDTMISRDGSLPNSMEADLDMNSFNILNLHSLDVQDLSYKGGNVNGILTDATAQADRAEAEADRAEDAANVNAFVTNQTVLIPSDYPTLQAAVDNLCTRSVGQNITITLHIESGHSLTQGLSTINGNFSNFVIESDDATVFLDPSFVPVGPIGTSTANQYSIFYASNAEFPVLNILVDADDFNVVGDLGVTGVRLENRSKAFIGGGAGVINASGFGLVMSTSDCNATSANFSYSRYGNRVTSNSRLNAPFFNGSNVRQASYSSGSSAGLDISRGSVVNITSTDLTNANLSNCAGRGLAVRRSFVSAQFVDASDCVGTAIVVEANSNVLATNANGNNSERLLFCSNSQVTISNSVGNNCTGSNGVQVQSGARVVAQNVVCRGTTRGIYVLGGSQASIEDSDFTGGNPTDPSDIRIAHGSIVQARNAVGGSNIANNTISVNGILLR